MLKKIRVRFAPSTTGPFHIGGLRTALYNYLFAKKYNGDFILRFENTDINRYDENSEKHIKDSLKWCNINIDFLQKTKKELYQYYIEYLLKHGYAYYGFDTEKDLKQNNSKFEKYGIKNRLKMKNSLTVSSDETDFIIKNYNYVVRLKIPYLEKEYIYIKDKLRGIIKFNIFELEDKILFRSNGMPTYHFASVIDDYTMNITHVIRGEEWISSTPIHVIIYNYFKWKLPEFIHLPLILDPNQKGKLSKRNILTYNFPIFPIKWYNKKKNNYINGFKEHGFLGDAITNWLFILGYSNPLKEIFYNIEDLIKEFDINKINSVNTILDINKIIWLNKSHINNKSSIELHELCNDLYQLDNNILSPKLIDIIKNRCTLLSDIIDISKSIIIRPNINKNDITFKLWNNDIAIFFKKICNLIERNELDINDLIKFIKINNLNIKNNLIIILRVIITGKSKGPNINDIINFLGKKEIILRIKIALISLE